MFLPNGISSDKTEEDLVKAFTQFGVVEIIHACEEKKPNVHITRNKEHGNALLGFGFVTFKTEGVLQEGL